MIAEPFDLDLGPLSIADTIQYSFELMWHNNNATANSMLIAYAWACDDLRNDYAAAEARFLWTLSNWRDE